MTTSQQNLPNAEQTIGILGAGRVGSAIARQALKAGYKVKIATSAAPEEIEMLVDLVVPGATAVIAAEASDADIVVVAIPLRKYRTLPAGSLAGRTVIDAMNYWAPTDGEIDDFETDERTTSQIVQTFLADAKIVKTLNHIGYHELEEDGQKPLTPNRRALALAGDHTDAKSMVATFIDRLGYDPIDAGPLVAGQAFGPTTEIFNGRHNATELLQILAGVGEKIPA